MSQKLLTGQGRTGANRPETYAATECGHGEILYHQGEICDRVYAVVSGYIKLARTDINGNTVISALLNANEIFGPGLYADEPRAAAQTASVQGRSRIRCYAGSEFRALIGGDPDLARALVTGLARREESAHRRLHAVLCQGVRARTAAVLHELVSEHGGRCAHGYEIEVPLTQQELAEFVGASRPVVSSLLNEFRRSGILDYGRDHICVDDLPALGRAAEESLLVSSG